MYCSGGSCVDDCAGRECGPSPVIGYDCGPCPQAWEYCGAGGQCVDDCAGRECGPSPTIGYDCGDCLTDEFCNGQGLCEPTVTQLCPTGQDCIQVGAGGAMGCLIPPGTVPPGNPTDCANTPCQGNYACYCLDAPCSQSVCIENCGECPAGTECCELWAGGSMGCLTTGCTGVPANPPYCDQNTPCQGNAGCYTDGTNNFCIDNCSVSYASCNNGDRQCNGDTVQECQNGNWVDLTDCTQSSQVCANGQCIAPAGLGDFCENIPCAAGLDCIGTAQSTHSFCTPQCDCTQGTGCAVGWECLFGNGDPPTTCWCAKLCITDADCPDGGAGGYECIVLANDGTNDIYGCMIL